MSIMTTDSGLPEAVSVGELCQMLSLSKRRFYELQKQGVFPDPSAYTLVSRRPIYFAEDIRTCLGVRRRNVGNNGQIVFFYAARSPQQVALRQAARPTAQPSLPNAERRTARSPRPQRSQHAEIIDALAALGVEATAAQVATAIRETFPSGTVGVDEGEVTRRLYQRIRGRNSADNVQR